MSGILRHDGLNQRLMHADAVRIAARKLLGHARAGELAHLSFDETRLDAVVDYVIETTRGNYPTGEIPFHARWRHFRAGVRDLWTELDRATPWASQRARVKAAYDLVIVSVLLDAGAGMGWRFVEPITRVEASKSEGLGLASFTMFREGLFSAHPGEPLRVDAERLQRLSVGDLRRGFQVGTDNPLVGVEGRTALLHRLGEELADRHADQPGNQRPSIIADLFLDTLESGSPLLASAMLMEVLKEFSGIWPERAGAIPGCGDVWCHPQGIPLTGHGSAVPFHKLSQWLTYSLIEPLQWAGHDVRDIDGLTGLPEYRNGGLLLDFGVLSLKDPADWGRRHDVSSALVVEWRALTVALLDIIAAKMRARLGLSAAELPLAKVLEGGTWAAGRRIAKEKRVDGGPPLAIISDGTVF
jgi:hypothetical protein